MVFLQKHILKIAFIFLSSCTSAVFAQTKTPPALSVADSLFQAKQYTQSMEYYLSIFNQDHQYSQNMLLKMAYIQEGLGHLSQSLYYLNLYYIISHDDHALQKMEEIAIKNNLSGYDSSDVTRFMFLVQQNGRYITLILSVISVLLFSMMVYQKRKNIKPTFALTFLILMTTLLLFQNNLNLTQQTAIITTPQTYLMSGPSAGASVIAVVGEGHKVVVNGRQDVWTHSAWSGQEVFIKSNDLLLVKL